MQKLGFYSFQVSPTNQKTVQFREIAQNEVKPLKLKCRSLSFAKCLACNLFDLPSLHPIYIQKQLNFTFACILLDQEVVAKFNFEQ